MPTKKSDLCVITKAKELAKYVITVTEKSPKKFRFTLVVRLQNYCLDVIENLLLDLLGYFAMICMEKGCILPNQFENIS